MDYYFFENRFRVSSINTIFSRKYGEDYYYAGERHDFWEMVYVEKGKLTVAEDEDVYELCEGQVIFHAPMEFHRFWSKKSEKPIFKIISFSLETNMDHELENGVFSLSIDLKKQLLDVYNQILDSFDIIGVVARKKEDSPVKEMLAVKKLEMFLLSVLSDASPEQTRDFSVAAGRYKEIIEYMTDHLYNACSLDDIAKATHLSPSYIKKLFLTYAGCGVMHYFTRLKIVTSLSYIRRGDSISEVSEMFAFSSPNYFSSVFKREMGMLPSEYRRKSAELENNK